MTDPNATQSFGTTAAVKPLGGTGPEAVDIDLDLPVLVQAAASPALAPVVPAAATAILSVAAQPAPAAPAATKPDWTDRLGKIINRLTRFWGVLGAMAGVGAVLSGMLGYWTIYHTVISGPTATSAPGPRMAAPALSIVVLPFANQTGDPQKGYIADALTTSISADLSRIREAFVIPAATAFIYRDKPVSVQEVGRDVGVRFVLNGSVLSSGEQVRINAQLSDAQSGAQLWSETFDGALGNLFALQDQVTNRIGNSIGREMVIVAARESETRKSSPKATDLMLRAAALRLKPQSLKNWQQIEELYRQVLALEPNNPRAVGALANVVTIQAANFASLMNEQEREKKYAQGRELVIRAKELDPDDPSIYVAMGLYAAAHNDMAGWRRAAEARLALDPKNPSAYNNMAMAELDAGAPQRAVELLTQAIALDPRHPADMVLVNMGAAHFMLGDDAAAVDWSLKAAASAPALPLPYVYLALAYTQMGDETRAQTALAALHQVDPQFSADNLGPPQALSPPAYREFWEKRLMPAASKLGLAPAR